MKHQIFDRQLRVGVQLQRTVGFFKLLDDCPDGSEIYLSGQLLDFPAVSEIREWSIGVCCGEKNIPPEGDPGFCNGLKFFTVTFKFFSILESIRKGGGQQILMFLDPAVPLLELIWALRKSQSDSGPSIGQMSEPFRFFFGQGISVVEGLLQGLQRNQPELDPFAAGHDRLKQIVTVFGGQDQDDMGWGFFQRFQECVLGRKVGEVEVFQNRYLVGSFIRGKGERVLELPDLINFDDLRIFLDLDRVEIGVLHFFDPAAGFTFQTGLTGFNWVLTKQSLGQSDSQRGFTQTRGAGQQIGMAGISSQNMLVQQVHCPLVADQMPIHGTILQDGSENRNFVDTYPTNH